MSRRRRKKKGGPLAPEAVPFGMPGSPSWSGPLSLTTRQAGVRVDETSALTLGAVFACVRVIAETLAALPFGVFEHLPGREGSVPRPEDPADWLLWCQANPETAAFTWEETTIAHTLVWGNGYSEIERDAAGRPVWLWQLTPDRVHPERGGGLLTYRVRNPGREDTILDAADVLHVKGLGYDGLVGYPVIRMAARSIGLGIAQDEASASLFGNDTTPGGMLTHPGRLSEKARENLRETWQRRHGGPSNRRTVAILEEGMAWQQTGLPPDVAQLVEQRQLTPADICRWFRVPPHKIHDLTRATFSNIADQNQEFVTDCLGPWATRIEAECNLKLFGRTNRGRRFTRHNFLALLRGDPEKRGKFYQTLMDRGVFSVNEVRRMEDQNPLGPEGDKRYVPLNMQELGAPAPGGKGPAAGGAAPDGGLLEVPDVRQEDPYSCILPGQELQGRVIGGSKAWYSGEAVEIRTARGAVLSVTANHPVLTVMGLVAAGDLTEGQHLLHYVGKDEPALSGDNEQHAPAVVEEVFRALLDISGTISAPEKVRCTSLDFHGDAARFEGEVEVVGSYGKLRGDTVANGPQGFAQGDLVRSDMQLLPEAGGGGTNAGLDGSFAPERRPVGGQCLCDPGVFVHSLPDQLSSLAPVPQLDSLFLESVGQELLPESVVTTDLLEGGTSLVESSQCVQVGDGSPNAGPDLACCEGLVACLTEAGVEGLAADAQIAGDVGNGRAGQVPFHQLRGAGDADALLGPSQPVRFGPASKLDVPLQELFPDGCPADSILAPQFVERSAGDVVLDQIIQVKRFHYDGPVYDFESPYGYIVVERLLISNCGAAAAMSVGRFFDVGPDTLAEWKEALGTSPQDGTRPGRIAEYLASLGLVVIVAHEMDLEDLGRHWHNGFPVICPVKDYGDGPDDGHYLTVIGQALGYVFCQDPSEDNAVLPEYGSEAAPGRVMVHEQDWLDRWHDTDADGKEYRRYGIAAGPALPEAPGEAAAETAEAPDTGTDGGGATEDDGDGGPAPDDSDLAAVRPLLEDACGRVRRRQEFRERDAQGRLSGEKLAAWREKSRGEQQTYARETLGPATLALARLAGGDGRAAGVALATYLDAQLAGGAWPAADLEARVLAACPRRPGPAGKPVRRTTQRLEFDDQGRACAVHTTTEGAP